MFMKLNKVVNLVSGKKARKYAGLLKPQSHVKTHRIITITKSVQPAVIK